MKRTAAAIVIALSLGPLASAAPAEAEAAWSSLSASNTVSASFTSVQNRSILSKPQQATGSFDWQAPDKLAWRWTEPFRSTFVLNGAVVGMGYPDLEVNERIDLSDNPELLRLVQGMTVWLGGDLQAVERDYVLTWAEGTATLVPKEKKLLAVFSSLEVHFAGEPLSPAGFTMIEPDGDSLAITLTTFESGSTIAPDSFALPE